MCLLHLHVRIQEFSPSGGGGGVAGPGPPDSKKLRQRFLLFNNFTEGTDPRVRWGFFGKQ